MDRRSPNSSTKNKEAVAWAPLSADSPHVPRLSASDFLTHAENNQPLALNNVLWNLSHAARLDLSDTL